VGSCPLFAAGERNKTSLDNFNGQQPQSEFDKDCSISTQQGCHVVIFKKTGPDIIETPNALKGNGGNGNGKKVFPSPVD